MSWEGIDSFCRTQVVRNTSFILFSTYSTDTFTYLYMIYPSFIIIPLFYQDSVFDYMTQWQTLNLFLYSLVHCDPVWLLVQALGIILNPNSVSQCCSFQFCVILWDWLVHVLCFLLQTFIKMESGVALGPQKTKGNLSSQQVNSLTSSLWLMFSCLRRISSPLPTDHERAHQILSWSPNAPCSIHFAHQAGK